MNASRVRGSTLFAAALLLPSVTVAALAQQRGAQAPAPPGASHEGQAFTFHRVRDDIYHAVGTGNMAVGANAAIVINASDVLLVDSHVSPAAAWVLLNELKAITPKPVRYVVNTHFHFDHLHGNQIYPPDVEIIGHEFTREMVVAGRSKAGRAYESFIGTLPQQIAALTQQIDTTKDPARRTELERRLAIQRNQLAATEAVTPTPPTATLSQRMTLFRGGREIRLLFFGRGHTGGDVVVYLPGDRVLMTGDLLTAGIPYLGDGYLNEWAETLEQLKPLAFDVILPGHGTPFQEREKIDHLQAYLRDLWTKAVEMQRMGVSAEDAARRIDMRSHAAHYPNIREAGVNPAAILRVYELLNGAR